MSTLWHKSSIALLPLLVFMQLVNTASAATDIANAPLANGLSNVTSIKPNIALVLDDSGSMDDINMPDDTNTKRGYKCWGSIQYNSLAYDPAQTYKPPYKPDGTLYSDGKPRFPDSSFTAAKTDGYNQTGSVNLSNTDNLLTSANTKYYYTNTANTGTGCQNDSQYTAITVSTNIAAPGVSSGSTEALRNYANWYSYYRKRIFMMKAAVSEAFSGIDDKYRIGLFFLNGSNSGSDGVNAGNVELAISDFNGTQRSSWFNNLFSSVANGWTPTRGALSRMGRMYAGQISGWDPVQYSCQKNFTIISSDGYWNTDYENNSYGPKKIDNSNVGNQDGSGSAAEPAKAKIVFTDQEGSSRSNGCYQVSELTVTSGTNSIDLLKNKNFPTDRCSNRSDYNGTKDSDDLGSGIASNINAKTNTTGFSAIYESSTNTLTITAPISAGNITSTPNLTLTKTAGTNNINYTASAFSGYIAAGSAATARPYLDAYDVNNTLADIAQYYYNTDLRTETLGNCSNTIAGVNYTGLCTDTVTQSGKDTNPMQHMTTYSVGLGVSGNIYYQNKYETAGDVSGKDTYTDIVNGSVNWPDPSNSDTARIDDLWHAAVNGRGMYYSTRNASTLVDGLKNALMAINASTGSSAAAATSNLEPIAGDNFVYVALYRTVKWDGDLKAFTIDPVTGAIDSTSPSWSAQSKLEQTVTNAGSGADGRTIKYFSASQTNKLKEFTYTNLATDGVGAFFTNKCTSASPVLTQCSSTSGLSDEQRSLINSGDNFVKYLRGQKTNESSALFRIRDFVLGDIVNAMPVYVKKAPFNYDKFDATYGTFKTNQVDRVGTVYAAANDGMLHAFNADNGTERWAYVPTLVMKNMYRLADSNYSENHRFFVDGSPTAADICITTTAVAEDGTSTCNSAAHWRTILVGGLNKGGRGYYALDITDPANPKGLWEFSETDMGLTYGNPIITRRKDGKWVVIVSSGYNNITDGEGGAGSGNGYLYVIDAATGVLLDKIATFTAGTTPAGTAATPSGLAKLNAWIEDDSLNTASVVYGGDLLGNLWRFDFDNNYLPGEANGNGGKEALLLANFSVSGTAQPITIKPELAQVKYANVNHHVVFVGTGKYMGISDPANVAQQSIYAVADSLTNASGIGDARESGLLVGRTMSTSTVNNNIIRTVTGNEVDWSTKKGWYLDLNPSGSSPGERVNVDMQLQFNILTVAANVPDTNVCNMGGYAWLYNIDIGTGKNLVTSTDHKIGLKLTTNALVAGLKVVKLTTGKTVTIVTDTSGTISVKDNPSGSGNAAGAARRTIWREIFD